MPWSDLHICLSDLRLLEPEKTWYVVYINAKWIYSPKNPVCIISECAIVRKVLHIILTCPLIYWCYGAANIKRTLQVWHSYLNFVKVNWYPGSAEIISKSHYTDSSIFPNMDCNISIISITFSVEFSPYYKVLEF